MAAAATLTATRWQSSSRANPCPVCGRNTDDKCRWNENVILCHQGDRFAPPAGLKLGDVLDIESQRWAVCSFNGGFAGAAVIFRPHVDRLSFTPAQRQRRAREQAALLPVLQHLFAECRQQVQACLAMPELVTLNAAEMQAELDHSKATVRNLTTLRSELVMARRVTPEFARYVVAVDCWLKLTTYQLRDVEGFMRVQLGIPTAEEAAALWGPR